MSISDKWYNKAETLFEIFWNWVYDILRHPLYQSW